MIGDVGAQCSIVQYMTPTPIPFTPAPHLISFENLTEINVKKRNN